ncbi:DNA-binding response regulator [Candidatus Gottesmanbacteria bacterium RIFCSPLOWO2_01_FULL_40_10]|nr:MAG: DNA-binding response regulator [Candidatus Gottesmanbacteria bacterium RIFCSPLOWO2_01_FULL_40_10]OGG24928.1 MAG: DNA-binding response regulator [Candidatus Gottesmanbacteria bacterium RIFCSPHIGHO2_12_FULL_40_13]OGG31728.1 MAG: DNA-binding response regulator [Candidatus Gottesmanbacteria bacterium RIFCSPLOWO2_02_FULL_40_10]
MRILVIEDERRLANVIKKGLSEDGFAVDLAFDGQEGQYLACEEPYDLIVLDLMLPKIDGVTICKNLRLKNLKTPILILTAKTTVEEKIKGLDSGADDYMIKPFSFLELRSRIHALIRRSKENPSPVLKIADLTVDPLKHSVSRNKRSVKLTPKEFAILEFLLRHKNEVVSRTMILEHVWDYNFDGLSNVVDVFMVTLRKKIDHKAKVKLIHTLHGIGYKISAGG